MIYVGEVSADHNILLEPFIDQCLQLNGIGVEWKTSTGETAVARIQVLACISDAKAKCEIQGFRQYNARDYPCTTCYVPGEARDDGTAATVFPYNHHEHIINYRTDGQTRLHAAEVVELLAGNASEQDKTRGISGVKFSSQLLRLPRKDFDIIR